MKRPAFTSAAILCCLALAPAAFAQASKSAAAAPKTTAAKKDAAPAVATSPAPVSEELMKARMKPPVKGTAVLEFIAGPVKVVSGEAQSVIKVKNIDNAPVIGLKIDEYFYAGQKEVSACTARVRSPIAAGEIVDVPISCPNPKEKVTGSNLMFTHSGGAGKVQPKPVKKFTEPTDTKAAATKKK
jgi:hypothetical protein